MFSKLQIDSNKMKGYKIKLYPTEEQKRIIDIQIDLFRYAYNWALNEANEYYAKNGLYIGKQELFRRFSEHRNNTEWLQGITLHSARLAMNNLDFAFKNFFKNNKGFPKFKSKKYSKKCVHYRNEPYAFKITENSVRVSGLPVGDYIQCKSHNIPLDHDSKFYNCTITFDGLNYWLSVNIERNDSDNYTECDHDDKSIGIDLGIKKFAQLSNGDTYYAPKILNTLEKRRRKQQSKLASMRVARIELSKRTKTKFDDIPMTKNEAKLKSEYLKTSIRMKNIRKSFIHNTTSEIVKSMPNRIVIEDLQVSSLLSKSKKMNNKQDIFHSMWYKFREVITYKSIDRGIELVVADNKFPSSQICSRCGNRRKQSNRGRVYICHECGLVIDRDLNAAINLSHYTA